MLCGTFKSPREAQRKPAFLSLFLSCCRWYHPRLPGGKRSDISNVEKLIWKRPDNSSYKKLPTGGSDLSRNARERMPFEYNRIFGAVIKFYCVIPKYRSVLFCSVFTGNYKIGLKQTKLLWIGGSGTFLQTEPLNNFRFSILNYGKHLGKSKSCD